LRVKKLVGVFTALAIALLTAVISIPSAAASSADAQFANRLYVLINDYRAQHALAPLRWDAQLSANSQSWTQQSADQANVHGAGVFQHSPGSYAFPENIVWNMSADQAFSWWVNSPAHRANMLRAADTGIGIGAVQLTAGPNRGAYLATAQFGQSTVSPEEDAAAREEAARAEEEKAAAEAAQRAAAQEAAAKAAAEEAAAKAAAEAAAEKAAAEKAAADAAAKAAAKAATEKAAADAAAKAAADKAAADAAAKAPQEEAAVPAPESTQAEQDKAPEEAAAKEAAAKKAAAEAAAKEAAAKEAAAQKAAEEAATKAAAEEAAAQKAAQDQAAEEAAAAKAAEEAAAAQAAEEQEAARAAAEPAAQQDAVELAAVQAETDAAAERAAAEEAAAAQAAAQKAAADAAAREAAERKAQAAAVLEQVSLGNEAPLTAAAQGTATAAAAGSQLRISGLEAAATYEVVLPSAGVNLGAMTADATGSLAVAVPAVLTAGEHKVALFKNGSLAGWTTFTVEQAVTVLAAQSVPAAADGTTELAATGLNAAQLAIGGIGTLMALTGAAALAAVQRQRSTSAR
jgi:hypothetical protein